MTTSAKVQTTSTGSRILNILNQYSVVIAFILLCATLGIVSPKFFTPTNLLNILDQSVVLTLTAVGMTMVIVSGGIDLSVPVALDFGALAAITLLKWDQPWSLAILAGILFGGFVGVFNAIMTVKIGISPFLATLGVLFIGESVQRIYTQGGEPIYMAVLPDGYKYLGRGKLFDLIPFDLLVAIIIVILFYLLVEQTIHGRRWRAIGSQYEAAKIAGLRVDRYSILAYIICSISAAIAGIFLSSSLSSYVPISGNGYLMDSIGATFIGTAIDPEGRPNIIGTFFGVIFLGVVANGLNLAGLNFYWQSVARGVVIFLALALGALRRRSA